jgi:uncharacterized metal-binding protein YceD (DUF177 family)
MKDLKLFTIQYVGLKEGVHRFDYNIDRSFFEHFGYEDFNTSSVEIALDFVKKSTLMELHFESSGSVNVNCDVTNEPYDEPINATFDLVVNFGNEFNNDNEELLVLPYGEYELNVAHYIYELIVLALPSKRVHPGVADGTLKSDILDKLEELSIPSQDIKEDKTEIKTDTDPRWDSLKKLLTDK